MVKTQVVIIGGGIAGLATAEVLRPCANKLTIVEVEPRVAPHQIGHNSGVSRREVRHELREIASSLSDIATHVC